MIPMVDKQTGSYHEFDDGTDSTFFPVNRFEPCPPRPSRFHVWQVDSGWMEDVAEAKVERVAAINAACAASITGGFTSSALGTPHTYDSEETDQLNLIGAVSLSADILYRCADANGTKDFRLHSAAQLKQVAADGALVKLTALQKASLLKAQIDAAGTLTEVGLVVW